MLWLCICGKELLWSEVKRADRGQFNPRCKYLVGFYKTLLLTGIFFLWMISELCTYLGVYCTFDAFLSGQISLQRGFEESPQILKILHTMGDNPVLQVGLLAIYTNNHTPALGACDNMQEEVGPCM